MRRPFPWTCLALACASLTLSAVLTTPAQGQESAGGEPASLARYVPKDELVIYIEFDGLDAHAEAWRKTAAYKILNTTTTGLMLEDLFVQLAGKIPGSKLSGTELLAVFKHVARSGFVFAVGGDLRKDKPDYVMAAFRNVFKNKEVAPSFARVLQAMNGPNSKSQAVIRAGHKVISANTTAGATFSWWVEDSRKEDLVFAMPTPEAADIILETLDGKRPNAVDHPLRADLLKTEAGFVPVGFGLVNTAGFRSSPKLETLRSRGSPEARLSVGLSG